MHRFPAATEGLKRARPNGTRSHSDMGHTGIEFILFDALRHTNTSVLF